MDVAEQKTGHFGPVFCYRATGELTFFFESLRDLFDLLHLGHKMPEQVLDAVLQRRRR